VDLRTEERSPRSIGIDEKSTEEVLRIINLEDQLVPSVVAGEIPKIAGATEAIVDAIKEGRRVFFAGAGTSGRLGVIEATEIPPTFGVPQEDFQAIIAGGADAMFTSIEGAEDDEVAGIKAADDANLSRGDVLVALTASGMTPFVLGVLKRAHEKGCSTIAVTCNPDSPVCSLVEIAIVLKVGAEIVAGSTRLKAGTAQKLVLNMLTTATMIRLGRVYDGYMVGVQPTNRKLVDRAKRIITTLAGVRLEKAESLLSYAEGDVRVAIILAKTGLSLEEARRLLDHAAGSLRQALRASGCSA